MYLSPPGYPPPALDYVLVVHRHAGGAFSVPGLLQCIVLSSLHIAKQHALHSYFAPGQGAHVQIPFGPFYTEAQPFSEPVAVHSQHCLDASGPPGGGDGDDPSKRGFVGSHVCRLWGRVRHHQLFCMDILRVTSSIVFYCPLAKGAFPLCDIMCHVLSIACVAYVLRSANVVHPRNP